MALRYQNGLLLTGPTSNDAGRTWSRWFYEMCIKIWGYTLVETNGAAAWTSYKDTGTGGASVSGSPHLFRDAGKTFDSTMRGYYLTIPNFATAARSGVYRIIREDPDDANQVIIDKLFSVHDGGIVHAPETGISWYMWAPDTSDTPTQDDWFVMTGTGLLQGGWTFDVRTIVQSSSFCYFPKWEMGPYTDDGGDWDTVGDAWNDSRNFERGFQSGTALYNVDECAVFAVGNTDNLAIHTRIMDDNLASHFTYIGEMTPYYTQTQDPYPGVIIHGDNTNSDFDNILGYGLSTSNDVYNGARGLANDETTTLTYYMPFFHAPAGNNFNLASGQSRIHSGKTGRTFTQAVQLDCRTAGNWELRGELKKVYVGNQDLHRGAAFGDNTEFLHTFGGLVFDWNGSGVHEPRL